MLGSVVGGGYHSSERAFARRWTQKRTSYERHDELQSLSGLPDCLADA